MTFTNNFRYSVVKAFTLTSRLVYYITIYLFFVGTKGLCEEVLEAARHLVLKYKKVPKSKVFFVYARCIKNERNPSLMYFIINLPISRASAFEWHLPCSKRSIYEIICSLYITILHHIGRTVPIKDVEDLAKADQYTCRELRTLVRKLVLPAGINSVKISHDNAGVVRRSRYNHLEGRRSFRASW